MNPNFVSKSFCACCNNTKLTQIYNFGSVPLAGDFILKDEIYEQYPLSISFCDVCLHLQVDQYVNSDILFKDYRYMSGYSMKSHFEDYINKLKNRFIDFANFKTIEIGSNDGTFLGLLQSNCKNAIGFEPSDNISKISKGKGNDVINDFFTLKTVEKNKIHPSSIDLITASNCFAHISEIDEILIAVNYLLKPESGTFIIEVHYTPNLIDQLQYDFIYHEHMYYYSLSSLNALLNRNGLEIYDYEFIPVHGGSIRVYSKKSNHKVINSKINNLLAKELQFYQITIMNSNFSSKINNHINEANLYFDRLKNENNLIIGFGASGRVNAFLNYINIKPNLIDSIFDESPEIINRFIPKVNIPIKEFKKDIIYNFDTMYLSAWNFSEQILSKISNCNYTKSIKLFPKIELKSNENFNSRS